MNADLRRMITDHFKREIHRGIAANEVAIDLDLISLDPKATEQNYRNYTAVAIGCQEMVAEGSLVTTNDTQQDGTTVPVYWSPGNEPHPGERVLVG